MNQDRVVDFTKTKKQYLTVILPDEKKTKLSLLTPTKKMLSLLIEFVPNDDTAPDSEELGTLYGLAAQIMSRNKTGHIISAEYLEDLLDFEDLVVFFTSYTEFIESVASSKN